MELSYVVMLVKKLNYAVSIIAIFIGFDLLMGARFTTALKRILDRTIVVCDHLMIKVGGLIRKTLDKEINFDKKILRPKGRLVVGCIMIVCAFILIGLTMKM